MEEKNDVVERTVMYQCTTHPQTLLIIASKFWIQKALLLNLYTMMLKIISNNIKEKAISQLSNEFIIKVGRNPAEFEYINRITIKKFNKILDNLDVIAMTPTKYVDGSSEIRLPYTIHAWSGILAIFCSAPVKLEELVATIKGITNSRKVCTQFLT
jgi:hypothetical protein